MPGIEYSPEIEAALYEGESVSSPFSLGIHTVESSSRITRAFRWLGISGTLGSVASHTNGHIRRLAASRFLSLCVKPFARGVTSVHA
jgi:hypothetical protein